MRFGKYQQSLPETVHINGKAKLAVFIALHIAYLASIGQWKKVCDVGRQVWDMFSKR